MGATVLCDLECIVYTDFSLTSTGSLGILVPGGPPVLAFRGEGEGGRGTKLIPPSSGFLSWVIPDPGSLESKREGRRPGGVGLGGNGLGASASDLSSALQIKL